MKRFVIAASALVIAMTTAAHADCWPGMRGMPPCTAKHGQFRLMVNGEAKGDFPNWQTCMQAANAYSAATGLPAGCGFLN